MKLSRLQHKVAYDDRRYRILVAGRRWGKSYALVNILGRDATSSPDRNIMYMAPTFPQAKDIIWRPLINELDKINGIKKINQSRLQITLVNNSIITLFSAEKPDRARGQPFDLACMDEVADFKNWDYIWQECIRPALSDRKGRAVFATTPKGYDHVKEMFDKAQDPDLKDWAAYSYTTLQGGRVDEEEVEAARAELDERSFQQEYEATFVQYSGQIYYAFDQDTHLFNWDKEWMDQPAGRWDPAVPEPLYVGMDFNVDPICAVIAIKRGKQYWVIDEVEIKGSNTAELVQEIDSRYPGRPKIAYPDASGDKKDTRGIHSDHAIIRQHKGWRVVSPRSNPEVRTRIRTVNSAFKSATGDVKLMIDHKCKSLRKCLERHLYKEGTQIPDKDTGFDHLNDALGYLCNVVLPIKTRKARPKGPRYFH